ncbi:MAG: hypothetical protein M3R30_05980, partial [Candidatus Eremiobacteraeota bacterium]|nr:hypothetical protein [Candidatus Eremiobacteraeota bacterium]
MASPRFPFFIQAGAFAVAVSAALVLASPRVDSAPTVPAALPSPEAILQKIRTVFRSHRPPPPFVSYTIIRKNNSVTGYPDYASSYTEHVWVRSSDRAALARRVYRDEDRGPLTFERPAFNEARDPGPPTADLFERAPIKPHNGLNDYIPTPEPSALENIASVKAVGETAYKVVA